MPATTITIDQDQRGGLYELVRNHLGSIEDFWLALERAKDFVTAERLGEEFAQDFRLLRDIGWSEFDVRERYVLTMSGEELADVLRRLQVEATHVLIERGTEAESSCMQAETDRRFRIGHEACSRILAGLGSNAAKP